jgi:hypothetical protein
MEPDRKVEQELERGRRREDGYRKNCIPRGVRVFVKEVLYGTRKYAENNMGHTTQTENQKLNEKTKARRARDAKWHRLKHATAQQTGMISNLRHIHASAFHFQQSCPTHTMRACTRVMVNKKRA